MKGKRKGGGEKSGSREGRGGSEGREREKILARVYSGNPFHRGSVLLCRLHAQRIAVLVVRHRALVEPPLLGLTHMRVAARRVRLEVRSLARVAIVAS